MLQDLRRLYSMRRLIASTALTEVRQRFAGSVLGLAWAVLFPVMQMAIYATLYVLIFKVRPSGLTEYQYVLMVFSGLIPLFIFNDAIQSAAHSIYSNKNLLTNAAIPVELIPLRAALAAQLPALIGLLITLGIGIYMGRTGWLAILMVPVLWVLLFMFAMGLGWILSLATLAVRDIGHGIGLVLMMLTFLSPFAYTEEMVPEGLKLILHLNPMTYFVLPFQQVVCFDRFPDLFRLGVMVTLSLGFFFFGFYRFIRTKHEYIDYA